jgi:pyruvate/2-oxoglutarate dehydrogenase complex dihydrolipoamide acyltransferase (E2) component
MPLRRVPFPPERRLVLDTLHLGRDKPMMHGLIELDVTRARRRLREHRERTGEKLSQTAFLLHAIGHTLARHPAVHARRDGLGRLVEFDTVDATVIVEVDHEGRPFPYAHVMRGLERRTVRALHDELHDVKRKGLPSSGATRAATRAWLSVPAPLRRASYRALLASPKLTRKHTGSLLVSAVGMFGDGAAFGLSAPGLHELSILLGGVTKRASTDPNDPSPREVLCATVSANHAIVDGAPLARFVGELARCVGEAEALDAIGRAAAMT